MIEQRTGGSERGHDDVPTWPHAGRAALRSCKVTRTFMFTDIVSSTSLLSAMGDEAWALVLDWHDTTLREVLRAHRGREVRHTGDGFFMVFDDPVDAIACAVSIQRTLVQHRRQHQFPLSVRIGVHLAEVAETPGGYVGRGIHEASRIAALAVGDEVLASVRTLTEASSSFDLGDARRTALRGVPESLDLIPVRYVAA